MSTAKKDALATHKELLYLHLPPQQKKIGSSIQVNLKVRKKGREMPMYMPRDLKDLIDKTMFVHTTASTVDTYHIKYSDRMGR